jgi:ribosomal protein L7Ae-like RNA K-turn-binding protein
VKQELPPPFAPKFKDIPKVTMGQQPPPEKEDKNKNSQKAAAKKQQLKKGEKPPRVFKYLEQGEQTKKV